jgi:hypothetical protein
MAGYDNLIIVFIGLGLLYWKYITQPRVIAEIVVPQISRDQPGDLVYLEYGLYKNSRGELFDFRNKGSFLDYLFS